MWIPRGDDIATYEREQRQRARQDLGRTRRGMGQAGGGGGRSGKRARADQVLYTAVLRSVELCSAVLFKDLSWNSGPKVLLSFAFLHFFLHFAVRYTRGNS